MHNSRSLTRLDVGKPNSSCFFLYILGDSFSMFFIWYCSSFTWWDIMWRSHLHLCAPNLLTNNAAANARPNQVYLHHHDVPTQLSICTLWPCCPRATPLLSLSAGDAFTLVRYISLITNPTNTNINSPWASNILLYIYIIFPHIF